MHENGWVKIYKSILEWQWYHDLPTRTLYLHCIFRANWKDGMFKGIRVPRGSFVSSFRKLAEETGLSVQQVRTAVANTESTHDLTHKQHTSFSVFTVVGYDKRQSINTLTNNESTTIEEERRYKNNIYSKKKRKNHNFEERDNNLDNDVMQDFERMMNENKTQGIRSADG